MLGSARSCLKLSPGQFAASRTGANSKTPASRIITFKRGAYWWSAAEGAYPLSAALESITDQGGWIETIPNPNYRPKGLFG